MKGVLKEEKIKGVFGGSRDYTQEKIDLKIGLQHKRERKELLKDAIRKILVVLNASEKESL